MKMEKPGSQQRFLSIFHRWGASVEIVIGSRCMSGSIDWERQARAGLSLQGLWHAFATGPGLEPLWNEVFKMKEEEE